jgi:hypothetical protein
MAIFICLMCLLGMGVVRFRGELRETRARLRPADLGLPREPRRESFPCWPSLPLAVVRMTTSLPCLTTVATVRSMERN